MKGFTLIELLVVVLIISILAAGALPQYELAVEKSRLSKALLTFNALERAEKVFDLANGQYTRYLDQLDIQMPGIGRDIGYGQNNWRTSDYYFWVDVVNDVFRARAIPEKSKKYILVMDLNKGEKKIYCTEYGNSVWPVTPVPAGKLPEICRKLGADTNGLLNV
uniref:Prepilin-type N-terminal cleavage/methylation domain-containing protein n=1 Tax=uncultured Elusimicrobia bacterium TaxID=699876 RepID=A0A650EN88_9BACT|nr:hypothetical protein Elusimicrob1349_1280 [uncultured Elusimicrobia bacterium]